MVYKILGSDITKFDPTTTHIITPSADGIYALIFSSVELTDDVIEQVDDANLETIIMSEEWLQPCI